VRLLDSGLLDLSVEESDLAYLIKHVVAGARGSTRVHQFAMRGASCLPAQLDSSLMTQVVEHLVNNAIEHNPAGCLIDIQLRRLSRQLVELSVRDHGRGVDLEDRAGLGQPFTRGRAASRTAGAGLGLYLSRRIVELHGGKLDLSFPPTGGTRVAVTLPISG
jgi:signal transduction histidine kinase